MWIYAWHCQELNPVFQKGTSQVLWLESFLRVPVHFNTILYVCKIGTVMDNVAPIYTDPLTKINILKAILYV